jgi:hypothetical protein
MLVVHIIDQYHGGTNFGRTSGGPYITTSYDYDAPLDEYGTSVFFTHLHIFRYVFSLPVTDLLLGLFL